MIDELFKLNISTLFLLQPLGLGRVMLEGQGFINAFLKDENYENPDNLDLVFLLFRPKNREKFKYFIDLEKGRTPLFIDEYDYEGGFVVLVYEFPSVLHDDFVLVKKGNYSSVSAAYRKTITQKTNQKVQADNAQGWKYADSMQWMVIHKDPDWRLVLEEDLGIALAPDDELWSKPDLAKETLTNQKLKEYERESRASTASR